MADRGEPSLGSRRRPPPSRRALLWGIAGAGVGLAPVLARAAPHAPFGPVTPPVPAPPFPLSRDDGAALELPRLLRGRITAVQLMFTLCTATCPIQGALFAAVARRLRRADAQLLSLSVDATNDRPPALAAWLTRFGAPRSWRAAVPREADVGPLFDYFRGRASGADRHSAQVYLFDREARLAFRTADMPTARHVAEMIEELARRR